jgi:hypothetical protein
MREGFDKLRELLERNIDPFNAAVRHHSKEIETLKRRRG